MPRILYSKHAWRDVKKLDPVVKKRLGRIIMRYALQPQRYAKKMIASELGQYRWRVGNYRIIFDLENSTIHILRIGHRRDIYR